MMSTLTQSKTFKNIKHLGSRPKNDQDNHCRENLCNLIRDVGCLYEICAEKLYMIYLATGEDSKLFCEQNTNDDSPFIFWSHHSGPNLTYEAFNMDFGPFNLATTHQFCSKMKIWLDTQSIRDPDKYIVIVLDDFDTERKLNITLLVAIAAIVLLNMTDKEIIQRLNFFMMHKGKIGEPKKELVFREKKKFSDVSGNQSFMSLTLEDCISAFYSALQLKFYDYYTFDQTEYLFYETVMSGDLNWVVPGKILAFAGPSDKPFNRLSYKQPPKFYHAYFNDHNVTTIIRLNLAEYDCSGFRDFGFDHHDLIFPDGYPPTSTIAAKFIKIVDEAKGAVAVHCYAGIGRTGTLIAAYLMTRYDFTPQMAVAWTRICRPGSVIGEQQDWLFTKFDRSRIINKSHNNSMKNKKTKPDLLSEAIKEHESVETNSKTTYAIAEKTFGQAKALMLTKKQREKALFERPCTRKSGLLKNIGDVDTSKTSKTRQADLVLDLGRTIPLMLHLADLKNIKEEEKLKTYRIKDGKYEWKVKFPEPGYVALKYDSKKDPQASLELKEHVYGEPSLDFRYVREDLQPTLNEGTNGMQPNESPKLKPAVFFSLALWFQPTVM